jgi:hypothetical protein
MKTIISQNDSFVREAVIDPIDCLAGHFSLQFRSVLLTARNPGASNCNFEAILEREGLQSLKDLLDAVLKG